MGKKHIFKYIILAVCVGALIAIIVIINSYLENKNIIAEQKIANENIQQQIENEQKDKQFDAQQKDSCLAVYKQESSKWGNVTGWRYNDIDNTCYIEYKETKKKTVEQCDADYKGVDGKILPAFFRDYLLCTDGLFEKPF